MSSGGNSIEFALRIRTLVQGADSVEDLRSGLGELADEMEGAAKPADALNRGLQENEKVSEEAGKQAKGTADHFEDLKKEVEGAANPTDQFNHGLRENAKASQSAGEEAKSASGHFGGLKDALIGLATLELARQILEVNDQLAALRRGFTVITGDATKTDEALRFVRETADRLGVGVADLAQSYLKLTAAAKGTQLEGAATEQIFSSLASAMSTVGAGTEEVDQAMTAIAQIMSKGVVSAEELRGQLGDVLPGAAQQAAESLLLTNAEFSKMLESGEIIASEFLPKFATQLEKAMGGGQGRVETFNAAWARLVNQLMDIATGPAGQGFTQFLTTVTDGVGYAARGINFLSEMVGALGRLLGGIAAGEFSEAFSDFGQSVEDASLHLMGAKTAAEQAAEAQKQMRAELEQVTPSIKQFQDAIDRRELKELPETLQSAVAELRKTGDAAKATSSAVESFVGAIEKNMNFEGVIRLSGALKAIGQEAKGAGADIQNSLAEALDDLTDEQLERLAEKAQTAMRAVEWGSDEARRALSELGLIAEAVTQVQLKRAAEEADNISKAYGEYAAGVDRLVSAQRAGLQAEIDLAKARGDGLTAAQKGIELAEKEAYWARLGAEIKQKQIQADIAATRAKIAELEATKTSSEEQKKANALLIEAQQQKLGALVLEKDVANSQAATATATAELTAQTQKFILAGYSETEAKKMALLASGQYTEAMKLEEEQRQKVTEASEGQKQADEAVAAAAQAAAEAVATAVKDAADQTQAAGNAVTGVYQGWEERLKSLSTAAYEAFQGDRGAVTGATETAEAAKKAGDALDALGQTMGSRLGTGFARTLNDLSLQAQQIEAQFWGQAAAAEELTQQLEVMAETGTVDMNTLSKATRGVSGEFDLLDQQQLDNLQSAIDSVNDKLRQTQEEARSARQELADMQADLLEAQGNSTAAEKLRLQNEEASKRADIEEKLTAAQTAGNRELIALYSEQLRLLDQIYDKKQSNLEKESRQGSTSTTHTTTTNTTTSSGGGGISRGGGISLTLNAPNARVLDNTFVEDMARALQPKLATINRRRS